MPYLLPSWASLKGRSTCSLSQCCVEQCVMVLVCMRMAMSPTCVTVSRGGGEWQGLWPWELVCFEPGQGPYCKARCPLFSGDRGWSQVLAKDLLYEQQPRLERPLPAGSLEISLQGHDASCHRHAGSSQDCDFSSWSRRQ